MSCLVFLETEMAWLLSQLALLAACGFAALEPETVSAIQTGFQPGERIPTFYVRAITGSLANKSVCYVCRNGDRPVVILLARDISPELGRLARGIDEVVDSQRAAGLRAFGVFATVGDGRDLAAKVQTFGFDEKLSLPLTITTAPPASCRIPDTGVTVILYRDQRVVSHTTYRAAELTPSAIAAVLETIKRLPE